MQSNKTKKIISPDQTIWRDLVCGETLQKGDRIMQPDLTWHVWDMGEREIDIHTYPCQRQITSSTISEKQETRKYSDEIWKTGIEICKANNIPITDESVVSAIESFLR